MRKLVLFSDPHLSSSYPFTFNPNPFKDIFFKSAYAGIRQPLDYAIENKCNMLCGGDWFDNEKIASPEVIITSNIFQKACSSNVSIIINHGNHEMDYQQNIPSITQSLINPYSCIKMADAKKRYDIINLDGLNLYMIRYYKSDLEFNEVLAEILSSNIQKPAALIIHQNIKGIQIGKTIMPTGIIIDEICKKLSGCFKFIMCGHLHHAYINSKYGVPLIIPGSTVAMDFRDEGSVKSFNVLTMDDLYNVVNTDTINLKMQINFITTSPKECLLRKDYTNCFVKLRAEVGDDLGCMAELINRGAIRVIPEGCSSTSSQPKLDSYARPLDMKMSDWLNKYLANNGYNEEEIDYLVTLNDRLLNGKN